jgi:RNA ligase
MKINIDAFNALYERKYLRKQTYGDLIIWNYTEKCTFERYWNEHTIAARGLITLADGTVHARSFSKFFNLGEKPGPDLPELPDESPIITRKEDGFLGISYFDPILKAVRIASRGSFDSPYAQWATEWLWNNNSCARPGEVDEQVLYSYVFEILYPHQRIVVDNSKRYGLVLLAAFNTQTGEEMSRYQLLVRGRVYRWPVVSAYNTNILFLQTPIQWAQASAALKTGTEFEGYVLHYPSTNLRVKIKGEDYCRIAKAVSSLSKRRIWELMQMNDAYFDMLLEVLPKEFQEQATQWRAELVASYDEFITLIDEAMKMLEKFVAEGHPAVLSLSRKDTVALLQEHYPGVWQLVLNKLDNKSNAIRDTIFKRIKPKHVIPTFKE